MEVIGIIAAAGFVTVAILLSLGFAFFMVIRAFRGPKSSKSAGQDIEETRLIQEIYHGLTKMGERVETLETLLVDDQRKKRADFDRELRKAQE